MTASEIADALIKQMNTWSPEMDRMAAALATRICFYPREALFVESPWYGVLEIVSEPHRSWGSVACWDGDHVGEYVAETLRPLTPAAAEMLGVRWGDLVWDEAKKRAWENEPFGGSRSLLCEFAF